ncbi:hypothetical protein F441_12419 [Phytophthora nicotianae CJ01A1]|uniref:Guided entry of tail-anchored proteins 1 n=7 Tax=Phytophthora nicotianae TaxID=4792 RepID=W2Q070_PHYN3|nr:hypothetical protein PPTG_14026 [Phytophthora nicotianae INRA-310]ETI42434.1 hypothetical protein F443_12433 [Phytophthora nicotianae P1569]ETK82452.1 hypothetical protein L915_12158 [Phytophthora nicotianae]ETO71052.1 hypothetical protein F444_12535 [Phytophthora nicotianae P1976]ETP12148.1 hypothetical protein F441_12419 [Phytophthora nicotianae CJ01A1]ETP40283.1 hypothetical protein F442_12354 [Phytophthora nicotianae P10297]
MTMELPTITALKVYDVLLIALVMFAMDLAMKLWNGRGTQLSPAEQKLMGEYNAQVRLVNRLNSVETFVEQAKATRKMNALKKEMQELAVERLATSAPSELQKQFDRIRTPALMGLLMLYYWNEPLVVLPQGYMLPVERLMSFPGFPLGAISAMGWAGICRRVSAKILS